MRKLAKFTLFVLFTCLFIPEPVQASKLVYLKVLDKDYIQVFFQDGEVTFVDDGVTSGAAANELVTFGAALNVSNVATLSNWVIKSTDDPNYSGGVNPADVYRKSKLTGMSQENWNTSSNDYDYDWAYEHSIFLKLPFSLQQGKTYTVEINSNTNTDVTSKTFNYDIFSSKSEAVKVNLVGYSNSGSIKTADLYMWMGDGGARDYSGFTGKKVYVYDVISGNYSEVGSVDFHTSSATETKHNHKMLQTGVWGGDFSSLTTPGKYRIAIEGVGCSEDFVISSDAYHDPFQISVLGYYYMRIGESESARTPRPRQPQYIPDVSPQNCKVYITNMSPYHPEWGAFSSGDNWDAKEAWDPYVKDGRPTNPNAYGGHSDAKDWDRHLAHVSNIYDMLLPYFLTNGAMSDDDLGIPESGNGIPDIIDEARNEVDFWLRLRYGQGYSHGLNNPTKSNSATPNVLYQADNTPMAAWANAANAAMLSNCFMISGHTDLMEQYRDSAVAAFNYASGLPDKMLTTEQEVGSVSMTGDDFRMTAAAFLYNVTGDTQYEDVVNEVSKCTGTTSPICDGNFNQIYATAGYLGTTQPVNYSGLYSNMKASIKNEARNKEADYAYSRPSRRASDNNIGWFVTEMGVQRTIVAHAFSDNDSERKYFEDALVLEYDWTLGRNPMNMIQMTTATTSLASKRSVENAYTSGWNDGTPGVHPGHTPYMNIYDWGGHMVMGKPTWMTAKNYPDVSNWPYGEMYYNTRFVYAANEFTPRQTMRGKMALYGYLYGTQVSGATTCVSPKLGEDISICGKSSIELNANMELSGASFTWRKDGVLLDGESSNTLTVTQPGEYEVITSVDGCVKSDKIIVLSDMPTISLGEDKELCSETEILLDPVSDGEGLTFEWMKDGEVLSADSKTYNVTQAGTYSVTVSASGCTPVSDEIVITSRLLDVSNDTICEAGVANLTVNESGDFSWYTTPTGGNPVATGASYSPSISSTTTYYVEPDGGVSTSIGKTAPGNSVWGSWDASLEYKYKFEVTEQVTLQSLDVYVRSTDASGDVNVVIYDANKQEIDRTIHNAVVGKNEIAIGYTFAPGIYFLDAQGSTVSMDMDNENSTDIAYPYEVSGIASITGTDPGWVGTMPWYLHFYNWKITSGNNCARTPVQAVLDTENENCVITAAKDAMTSELRVYPNPSQEFFRIETSESFTVKVYSLTGELFHEGRYNGAANIGHTLPAGLYMIKVEANGQSYYRKVSKL